MKDFISIPQLLIAVVFGAAVGNDLLPYGGGNTLLGWTLLEKYCNRSINVISWEKMFLIPTLLELLICGLYLYFVCFENKKLSHYETASIKPDFIFIIKSFTMLAGIFVITATNNAGYALIFAIVALIIGKFSKNDFMKLPYKALYIWSGSYLLGNLINAYLKAHYHFMIPPNVYTIFGIFAILILVGSMTQFITNTGIAAFTIPIILNANFGDNIWLFTLVMKAIGISYCTILANGCMAVSSSYGLKQKDMVKYGLPVLIIQIFVFGIYFYLMRGRIIL